MLNLQSPLLWAALLALLLCGVWLGVRIAAWRVRRRIARHRKLGRRGESRAVRLLERAGYTIESEQASSHLQVTIDGEDESWLVRADFIVGREGRRYVAEAKGGETSASLATAATRRQLLEYTLAFDTDGVLLVDAARGAIHTVSFPQR
jgi:hypothetical protein